MKYQVTMTLMISPDEDNYSHNMLTFSRRFTFGGEKFRDIADRVDALYDAIEKGLEHGTV